MNEEYEYWKDVEVEPTKNNDTPIWVKAKDLQEKFEVLIKWDGCMSFSNIKTKQELFHICDIDDFILELEELRDKIESQVVY